MTFYRTHCLYALLSLSIAGGAAADGTGDFVRSPDFIGGAQPAPPLVPSLPQDVHPSALPVTSGESAALPAQMSEAEFLQMLKTHPEWAERLINGALQLKRWDWLEFLLPLYRAMPGHDAVLADFAEGIMWRERGRHKDALGRFRSMIAQHPDLHYVRLHLAAMLFEDKQYEAAEDQFRKAAAEASLPAPVQEMVAGYLAAIQKQHTWHYNVGFNYEQTDNVNNASAEKLIMVNGKCLGIFGFCLQKDQDSLPKAASGIRYHADAGRDWNIAGNHYFSVEASVDGVTYRNAHDFDELSGRAAAGYGWRDVKRQFVLMPYVEQMRLGGGNPYSRGIGVMVSYSRWLSPKWQALLNGDVGRTVYQVHQSFDNNRVSLGATAVYLPSPKTMLFSGVDGAYSKARSDVQSYRGYGVRSGAAQEFPWGISARVQLRYGEKDYRGINRLYGYARYDKEYLGSLAVWHRAVSVWGITPKVNLQYSKTNSNMASFYSRDAKRVFVSLEKTF